LVDIYSKKTEAKLVDKGRAQVQKRNQDIQSSLNIVDEQPKRAHREGSNPNTPNGKHATARRSFGASRG